MKREKYEKKLEEKTKQEAKNECVKLANMTEEQRKEYFEELSCKVELLTAELKDLNIKYTKLSNQNIQDFEKDTVEAIFNSSSMICTALIGGLLFITVDNVADAPLIEKYLRCAGIVGLSSLLGFLSSLPVTMGISARPISKLILKTRQLIAEKNFKKIGKKLDKANNKFEIVKERYNPSEEKTNENYSTKKQAFDRPLKTFEMLQYGEYERRYRSGNEK